MKNILFFADRLPPLIGGMEMHANYFIKHFTNHDKFPISGIITKDEKGQDCLLSKNGNISVIDINNLSKLFDPDILFFNSGRWIENMKQIRNMFKNSTFFYRTGGNEILKAPLTNENIADHSLRQAYWVKNLNDSIDIMITNSFYTEKRLKNIGITCSFAKCVGGVNVPKLKISKLLNQEPITIFCAARFVPYKNHHLLISVIRELILKGHNLVVRLAGDGSLLKDVKKQVGRNNLTKIIKFLGSIDNNKVCQEIVDANIYMQLSCDLVTKVEGGSYVHSECMGRSILEAITLGTFVIAGKSGALSEVITKNRGMLVNLDSSLEKITDDIEKVLKNVPAKRNFTDEFIWEKIFNRYEDLFDAKD
ncbi:MAG: glycosyltransferase family 4 protein [Candidatus Thorarchaeota archaeon]